MGFLIALIAPRLGKTAAGFIVYGGLILIVLGSLWYYGHTRYQAGVADTDDKWKKAGELLEKQAVKSAGGAETKAVKRIEAQNDIVAKQKEKLDAAEKNGDSALDVLFGGGVR